MQMTDNERILQVLLSREKPETFDPATIAETLKVDPGKIISRPETLIELDGTPIATAGNFSLITGKAKSRKTMFLTCLAAAAIAGRCNLPQFTGSLPENRKTIFFDTEQSDYHVHMTYSRILRQAGHNSLQHFEAYGLRPLKPSERLAVIEYLIQNNPAVGMVFIDGIRDLVTSINDEQQATDITSRILKWTHIYKIHICLVLHQNKSDLNARGHLGTELMNKAETVLTVKKDERDSNISTVTPEYCRDIDPEPFAFQINSEGLPELADVPKPDTRRHETMAEHFRKILPVSLSLPYNELVNQYKEIAGISDSTSKRHISEAMTTGLLMKNSNGLYKIKNPDYNDSNDIPF